MISELAYYRKKTTDLNKNRKTDKFHSKCLPTWWQRDGQWHVNARNLQHIRFAQIMAKFWDHHVNLWLHKLIKLELFERICMFEYSPVHLCMHGHVTGSWIRCWTQMICQTLWCSCCSRIRRLQGLIFIIKIRHIWNFAFDISFKRRLASVWVHRGFL